jgi:hypothetical protein
MTEPQTFFPNERKRAAEGYHVVPQQLALAGLSLVETSAEVYGIISDVEETRLGEDDLGILGREADDAPGAYNDALDEYIEYFHKLRETLSAAGELVYDVAQIYAAKEDSYYEKFNQISMH